jgi:serine protease AprX
MRIIIRRFNFVILFGLIVCQSFSAPILVSGTPVLDNTGFLEWRSKVDAWVLDTAATGETEFLIFLNQQADLSQAALLNSKIEKGLYVYQRLTETAQRTQPPLLAALKQQGIEHHAYWIANMVWARSSLQTIQSLAQRSDVAHIYANPSVHLPLPQPSSQPAAQPLATNGIEWNISKVRAPEVWSAGYTGQGAVVGGQDTGYDWDHEALIRQYRGWDGFTAEHDYNWHDAIHENNPHTPAGNPCGFDSPVPCDDDGHGTHTMGIMVGDNGSTKKIGMAPGARWIGCRNMEQDWGKPSTYAECYQWFIAPTRIDGSDPRPNLAPDVINNSWSCPPKEGCTDPNILLAVVNNVRAAGILTAHAAGNDGGDGNLYCYTVNTPAAIYAASFSVGATDDSDIIASFSSRGPVSIDGSYRMKPDVSAPGVSIYSSLTENGYGIMSGTSMAAPHAAGLVALLISANPLLRGNVDGLEDLIEHTATPRTTTSQSCGGIPGTDVPNNTYGWGRIDAWSAFQGHTLLVKKIATLNYLAYGLPLTYTISINHIATITPTTNIILTDTLPAGTTFITATLPHTLIGNNVQWELPILAAGETTNVKLAVRAPFSGTTTIVNSNYGAISDQVSLPRTGSPVTTTVGIIKFLPFFFAQGP